MKFSFSISRFSNLTKRQRIFLGSAGIIICIFLYSFLIYIPLNEDYQISAQKFKKGVLELKKIERAVGSIPQQRKKKEEFICIMNTLEKRFLMEKQIPEFLKQIGDLTIQFNLNSSPPNPKNVVDYKIYKEQRIRIDNIKSDYHTIGRFINTLENLPVLINVNEVQITSGLQRVASPGVMGREEPGREGAGFSEVSSLITGSLSFSVYIISEPSPCARGLGKEENEK